MNLGLCGAILLVIESSLFFLLLNLALRSSCCCSTQDGGEVERTVLPPEKAPAEIHHLQAILGTPFCYLIAVLEIQPHTVHVAILHPLYLQPGNLPKSLLKSSFAALTIRKWSVLITKSATTIVRIG